MTAFPHHIYTADDVADAERDLAGLLQAHEAETDPAFRAMYAEWIEIDGAFLSEMREAVFPPLPLVLPLGVPAPGSDWRRAW